MPRPCRNSCPSEAAPACAGQQCTLPSTRVHRAGAQLHASIQLATRRRAAGERTQPAQHQVHAARGEINTVVLALQGEVAVGVHALALVHGRLAQRLGCAPVRNLRTHFAGRQEGTKRCWFCCTSRLADTAAASQIGAPSVMFCTSCNAASKPTLCEAGAGGAPCWSF